MNKEAIKFNWKILTIIFGIVSFCGVFYYGIGILKYYNTFIATNGLSVRHVVSDKAVWYLTIITESNTMKDATSKLQADKAIVLKFLKDSGITSKEISEDPVNIEDNFRYSSTDTNKLRFKAKTGFSIQSQNLETVKNSSLKISELMEQNIWIESNVRYLYTGMDKLRIDMINDATKDSKNRAEKVADSLGVKLTGIRNISTGKFSIVAEDAAVLSDDDWHEGENSIKKRVRVVVHGSFNIE